MPTQEWFILQDGSPAGPFTPSQFRELASKGLVMPESQVSVARDGAWHPASRVRGLFDAPTGATRPAVTPDPSASASRVGAAQAVGGEAGASWWSGIEATVRRGLIQVRDSDSGRIARKAVALYGRAPARPASSFGSAQWFANTGREVLRRTAAVCLALVAMLFSLVALLVVATLLARRGKPIPPVAASHGTVTRQAQVLQTPPALPVAPASGAAQVSSTEASRALWAAKVREAQQAKQARHPKDVDATLQQINEANARLVQQGAEAKVGAARQADEDARAAKTRAAAAILGAILGAGPGPSEDDTQRYNDALERHMRQEQINRESEQRLNRP